MSLHLPYRSTDINDESLAPEASATELFEFLFTRGKRHAEAILAQLINDVANRSEYVAACLITGGAHGYEMQELLLQSPNDTLFRQRWNDISSSKEDVGEYVAGVDIKLVTELQALRESHFTLRDAHPINKAIGGLAGQYMLMYLAVNQDGEWLSCSSPLLDHTYKSNPITRICRAFGWRIILA